MRIVVRSYLVIFGLFLTFSLRADPGPLSIWFTNPAVPGNTVSWYQEALPVGNGKLAAMVYGGVTSEQIQFNEDTIWGGQPHDYNTTNKLVARFKSLQTNCFSRTLNATMLADEKLYLLGNPLQQAAYQNPGALVLTFFPHSGAINYLRSLDLNTATVNVHYDYGSVTYNRDIFASAPSNKVIAIHFTANQSDKIAFTCSFTTGQTATYSTSGNDLVMHASVTAFSKATYGLANMVQYDARMRLLTTNGTVTTTSSSISVTNANDVTLLLSVASNVKNYNDLTADYVTSCSNNVAAAAALGYTALRQAQQDDYTNLFKRVVLDLGANASRTNQGVGYRKKQIGVDGNDPQLMTLVFQLGRYLMIAGSRPGSQALNLQGKWNDNNAPGWDSKMTLNINEEMNYWGAEVANLSECTLPLFDMMWDLKVTGNRIATNTYFLSPSLTNAWVAHHNTDLWRAAAPCNGLDGTWPTGGAWLCQHVWWHYQYTGGTNWLDTNAYPLMKGAAQFFEAYLIPHTNSVYTNSLGERWMVTCPSYSPEHDEGTYNVAIVPGPTMDNELVRDLFSHVVAANLVLTNVHGADYDYSFRTNILRLLRQLPPDQVGSGGQLQEWLEDVDATYDSGHRHCSHLVGLSPGDEISPFYTPATAAAAKHSVDMRGDNGTGTPWSMAVRMNLRTRLQDGDGAFHHLTNVFVYNKFSTNMVFSDNNRQLDATFGIFSGIAEMFLQSQSGEVYLLPALPGQLTNGSVSGLCAQGGFEVDNMTWTNGRLTGATIYSKVGNPCRLRPKMPVNVMLGTNYVDAPMVLPGLYQFSTIAGSNYTIVPATAYETENLSATVSSGDTHQIKTNAAFSNLRGTLLTANAADDYVTYTVPNVTAGTYRVYIGADAGTNRGKFQLKCGPSGGTLTNVGSVQDTYSATNMAYLLPTRLTTTTNLIVLWTNMLKELDYGTNVVVVTNTGNYDFKFIVAGSSNYNLAFDYIKLTPAASQSTPSNAAPAVPVNLLPANGAANQLPTLALQSSAFSDPDGGDTHAASEWLIWRGSTNVFDSGTDFVNQTNLTVPAGALDYGTTYNWQVRYQDNHSSWGGYSTLTAFSTVVPTLGASGLDGKLVFAWPTNTAGFFLECVTNLPSTNWVPATPPPVVVGGSYVVTNTATAEKMFYRLHKP
jgi:alpha-L-fucosidase 2